MKSKPTVGELVFNIRNDMWSIYNKGNQSAESMTRLINKYSTLLAEQIEQTEKTKTILKEMTVILSGISLEDNDRKATS